MNVQPPPEIPVSLSRRDTGDAAGYGPSHAGRDGRRPVRAGSATRRRRYWGQTLEGYLFVAPWIVGFVTFTVGAMLYAVWMSFQRWNLLAPPQFVGLANYQKAFCRDPLFWQALANTAYYAFVSVPLRILAALLLAVLLNQSVRGLPIFRTIFYLPSVVTGVATSMLWMLLLNPDVGGINFVLRRLGVAHPPGWLTDEHWAMPALILMSLWSVGGMMLIFLAGLQSVPDELLDAAHVDGAGAWHRFRHITVPMLTPAILFNLVISVIAGFQVFTQTYIMTGGGPANATLTYVLYLYRNAFEYFRIGYASALAWILFFIILGLTLLILRSSAFWVHYEGERH
ncbi:MAG TPA: sugar ABC transporter permease [Chthonomonadaceae bacterium]|nr:sugar ABC transporter permease [Chthonomonadaceae bacterium]